MPKAQVAEVAVVVESIPLERISESKFNPRKSFTDLEELAEDVKRRGVLQPVLVRPFEDGSYQLIFGARRYRAATMAGLKSIPAMVRDMTDAEALEIAIVENAKRADVHPLEEADAYRELHERHGYDVDTIAAKVGKSKGYVYARMKLCELGEAGRKAFFDGALTAATALMFARIGDPATQEGAVQELVKHWGDGGPIPLREVAWQLRQRFMQDLARAPFDTADANLLASAGACTNCPKRSGANPDLFSDIQEKDICTDPKCFQTKVAHAAERKKTEAAEKGLKVLEQKEAEKALGYGSGYVKLSDRCYDHPKGKTWGQALKKAKVEKVVAIGQDGAAHELVRAKDAKEALVEAGEDWAKSVYVRERGGGDSYSAQQRKAQQAAKLRAKVVLRALVEIGNAVRSSRVTGDDLWRLVAVLALNTASWEALRQVQTVMDIDAPDSAAVHRAIAKKLDAMDREGCQELIIQLMVGQGAAGGSWQTTYGKDIQLACSQLGVDLKAIEKRLKAEAKEKDAEKAKPKKARKAVAA